jgi:hypothetical protein
MLCENIVVDSRLAIKSFEKSAEIVLLNFYNQCRFGQQHKMVGLAVRNALGIFVKAGAGAT